MVNVHSRYHFAQMAQTVNVSIGPHWRKLLGFICFGDTIDLVGDRLQPLSQRRIEARQSEDDVSDYARWRASICLGLCNDGLRVFKEIVGADETILDLGPQSRINLRGRGH